MSKDKALDKWLDGNTRMSLPKGTLVHDMAREAWHAAVKHTLSFVAETLRRTCPLSRDDDHEFAKELAGLILKMKP